jgi:hypothetical protein
VFSGLEHFQTLVPFICETEDTALSTAKLFLGLTKYHAMKTYGGMAVSGQLHAPAALPR